MVVEDKISTIRFNADIEPHIKVNTETCETCYEKPCLYVCPVQNYVLMDGKVVFSCAACMECGACRIACPKDAIEWNYPRGGYGVCFRYG